MLKKKNTSSNSSSLLFDFFWKIYWKTAPKERHLKPYHKSSKLKNVKYYWKYFVRFIGFKISMLVHLKIYSFIKYYSIENPLGTFKNIVYIHNWSEKLQFKPKNSIFKQVLLLYHRLSKTQVLQLYFSIYVQVFEWTTQNIAFFNTRWSWQGKLGVVL